MAEQEAEGIGADADGIGADVDGIGADVDSVGADAETGGGILSQSELDALLAAVDTESAISEDASASEGWGENVGPGDTPEPGYGSSVVDLPSFDLPGMDGVRSGPVASHGSASMNRVRDIPLEVTVELGRTRLLIRDILDLGTGSIIELDKLAGEPVDLFANGLIVARGEVIVIDDNFGVRVTEIITAAERRQIQDAEADALAA